MHNQASLQETKQHGAVRFPFNLYPCTIPGDFPQVALHWQESMELVFVKRGAGLVQVGAVSCPAYQGDIFIFTPGTLHALRQAEGQRMEDENSIFELERLGGAEGAEQNPDDGLPDKQATSFIVKKAIAYIEQNYAKKLSLQEVADFCYVSQWHLLKLINKYAEKSYYDLLNSVRIEKAKELLADPSLKIGDIVDLVGYSDSGHFSRTFKKLTGLSANEYRSRLN